MQIPECRRELHRAHLAAAMLTLPCQGNVISLLSCPLTSPCRASIRCHQYPVRYLNAQNLPRRPLRRRVLEQYLLQAHRAPRQGLWFVKQVVEWREEDRISRFRARCSGWKEGIGSPRRLLRGMENILTMMSRVCYEMNGVFDKFDIGHELVAHILRLSQPELC